VTKRLWKQNLSSSRRTSLILKLSFRNWNRKKLARITQSKVLMMRSLIKMRSSTSSTRKRSTLLNLELSLLKTCREHPTRLITSTRSNRN